LNNFDEIDDEKNPLHTLDMQGGSWGITHCSAFEFVGKTLFVCPTLKRFSGVDNPDMY
jgi:hypothetical protein